MNNTDPKVRLKQFFESTIDSGIKYFGNINEIDYYTLLCQSTANNTMYKIIDCNLLMFNYQYNNKDSVLMIFSIPLLNNENKHISEKIMDVLKLIEDCFITIDHMDLKNSKEDKFYYLTVVKNLKDEDELY